MAVVSYTVLYVSHVVVFIHFVDTSRQGKFKLLHFFCNWIWSYLTKVQVFCVYHNAFIFSHIFSKGFCSNNVIHYPYISNELNLFPFKIDCVNTNCRPCLESIRLSVRPEKYMRASCLCEFLIFCYTSLQYIACKLSLHPARNDGSIEESAVLQQPRLSS